MRPLLTLVLAATVGWLPQVARDRTAQPAPLGTAIIEGRVTFAVNETLYPVRRAKVVLESETLSAAVQTDTDTEGRFRFERLSPGTYRVRSEKPGFVPVSSDTRPGFEPPASFNLAAGQTLALNFAMVRGAALEGRVLKDTGESAENAVVTAMRVSYGTKGRRGMPVSHARTDDRGRFRIHTLPAGEYYLEASSGPLKPPHQPAAAGPTVSVGQGLEVAGLDMLLPGVPGAAGQRAIVDSTSQGPPAIAQPDGSSRISGVVTREGTNQPVPDVTVRALRSEGGVARQVATVRTDDEGRFVVDGLRAGEYALLFTADRSLELWLGQRMRADQPRHLRLVDGQHFNNADMTLPGNAAIEGRLLDEFGDPAPGMQVQAARVVYASGKTRLMLVPGARSRPTNDLGQFRISLPPSEYYLIAVSGVFAGPEETRGFLSTYFPGTTVPTAATPVSVALHDVTDIVFSMVPGPLSTLSGVVTNELGKPAEARMMLVPTSDGDVQAEIVAQIQTSAEGAFVVRNVPMGSYALQAFGRTTGPNAKSATASFGALQLTVDGDLSDLVVKTTPGVTLRGRVVLEGPAQRPEPSTVRFLPAPVSFATGPAVGVPVVSVTNDDWTFEVKNMMGSRVITAPMGAPGWTLKSVLRDGRDITDQPIHFGESDVVVEVTLTSSLATITGTVTDANKPVAECQVIVFSDDLLKWAYPSRHVKTARTDAKGMFTVSGLPPGNYLAIAYPSSQSQNYQDPAVLGLARGFATTLTLQEGGQASIALRLVRR